MIISPWSQKFPDGSKDVSFRLSWKTRLEEAAIYVEVVLTVYVGMSNAVLQIKEGELHVSCIDGFVPSL